MYTSRHVREQSSSRARVARMRSRYSVLGSGKECWRQSRRRRAVLPVECIISTRLLRCLVDR